MYTCVCICVCIRVCICVCVRMYMCVSVCASRLNKSASEKFSPELILSNEYTSPVLLSNHPLGYDDVLTEKRGYAPSFSIESPRGPLRTLSLAPRVAVQYMAANAPAHAPSTGFWHRFAYDKSDVE